jgi:dTDP-4-dehydrorhamnose 3,5-epimerase
MNPLIWIDGAIDGVIVRPLQRFEDHRGWLAEMYRDDETPAALRPVMIYVSVTRPGECRGPHEHRLQTDWFCFPGFGTFEIWLWDPRPESSSCGRRQVVTTGREEPLVVIVPPAVVHAYRNVSAEDGLVINCPNALYRGPGRSEPVDEIRHEDDPASPYRLE